MSDRILGACALLLGIFYIWQATLIEESFLSDPVGPKAFPIIIGAVVVLSSAYFIWRPDTEPEWPGIGRLAEIGFAVAVMVGYTIALPEAGFVISTAVAAAFLAWRLGAHAIAAVIAGIVTSVGIYVVFHLVLGLSLARGPWGF
ncbi:MAG: tripartite tricarboxylate transporter TctB family protein [Rhizobiaceae bacterium]|nr:tripartite tricarboxylate transporter TctB family protein [Rhizobiaceae bacterium]MCC0042893.1 tripartite tricarboxylate transporter TctB family protein [Brucellaceae bacterium]